ncbi:MAG: hypothetical protein PHQ23_07915 [Candidatus Wallbacteria bacterium]|nr:hypothetical protein [Candidatus Wallbacteria bacterium]
MPLKIDQADHLPEGFSVFEDLIGVAGIKQHIEDARAFSRSASPWLEMERDQDSGHNASRIKIHGCSRRFLFRCKRLIGYVPEQIARPICEGGFFEELQIRLVRIRVSGRGAVHVLFRIIGPKTLWPNFRELSDRMAGIKPRRGRRK